MQSSTLTVTVNTEHKMKLNDVNTVPPKSITYTNHHHHKPWAQPRWSLSFSNYPFGSILCRVAQLLYVSSAPIYDVVNPLCVYVRGLPT